MSFKNNDDITKKLEAYLQKKKWVVRDGGSEYIIQTCPFCGSDKSKFYINKLTGLYHCHRGSCNESGNFYSLQKVLGDLDQPIKSITEVYKKGKKSKLPDTNKILTCHSALLRDKEVMSYLKEDWGLERGIVEKFKLGVMKDKENVKWLTIPHAFDGTYYNLKRRSLPPASKQFKRFTGGKSVLFNLDAIKEHKTIIITEGEKDALTLLQHGYTNVLGTTTGAGSFSPGWIDDLEYVEKIYLVYDSDIAGVRSVKKVAEMLGLERCRHVQLPSNDVNDYFVRDGGTKEEFDKLLRKSRSFEVDSILSLSGTFDALEESLFFEQTIDNKIKTPWPTVNNMLGGGISPGDLIIFSARPKTGKTTLCMNIVHETMRNMIPALMYCLEMRPEKLLKKLISIHRQVDEREITEVDLVMSRFRLENRPLYFGHAHTALNLDMVVEILKQATRRYGIKLVIFDNLNFLTRAAYDVTKETGNVTKTFKLLAEELGIAIILIAQPRKTNNNKMLTSEDLKDSSSIHADGDAVVFLHRKMTADRKLSNICTFIVDSGRYVESGASCSLMFDGAKSLFTEINSYNDNDDDDDDHSDNDDDDDSDDDLAEDTAGTPVPKKKSKKEEPEEDEDNRLD